jgi:hypothetical protein
LRSIHHILAQLNLLDFIYITEGIILLPANMLLRDLNLRTPNASEKARRCSERRDRLLHKVLLICRIVGNWVEVDIDAPFLRGVRKIAKFALVFKGFAERPLIESNLELELQLGWETRSSICQSALIESNLELELQLSLSSLSFSFVAALIESNLELELQLVVPLHNAFPK